jgi:hypothetical protein
VTITEIIAAQDASLLTKNEATAAIRKVIDQWQRHVEAEIKIKELEAE